MALSGRTEGRVDGVEFLANILKDGSENYSASSISIPKQAVLQDKCKFNTLNSVMKHLLTEDRYQT